MFRTHGHEGGDREFRGAGLEVVGEGCFREEQKRRWQRGVFLEEESQKQRVTEERGRA